MENENKWEYDYSASNNETGYPNVGSSGMNTANQYNEPEAQPARPADTAPADGGSVPPFPPEQPQYSAPEQPEKPRRKKKFNGGKLARSAVALVLAAAMGFAGGFAAATGPFAIYFGCKIRRRQQGDHPAGGAPGQL